MTVHETRKNNQNNRQVYCFYATVKTSVFLQEGPGSRALKPDKPFFKECEKEGFNEQKVKKFKLRRQLLVVRDLRSVALGLLKS